MKTLRNAVPLVVLAALTAAGCFLVSGQFVVNYPLPTPFTFNSAVQFASIGVDLNTISDYSDHKSDLKRVDDLALIGDFHNNSNTAVSVEAWIAPAGTSNVTWAGTSANDVKLWGPLTLPASSTVPVDWNRSARLFVGRQTLIDELKGDGKFAIYIKGTGASFNVTVTKGALIAVIAAAK